MIAALDQVEPASARQCGARPSRIGGNGRKGKGVYKQESDRQAAADIGSDPPEIGKIATNSDRENTDRFFKERMKFSHLVNTDCRYGSFIQLYFLS
jgi:hypothetical protein